MLNVVKMRKTILLLLAVFCMSLVSNAQTELMRNLVLSKNFKTTKEIYPTFTEGVVAYELDIMYIYGDVYIASSMPDSANHSLPIVNNACFFPLVDFFKKNQGEIYPGYDDEVYLFLRLHYDASKTYAKLWDYLKGYYKMLTFRHKKEWQQGKVRIILVGNAPIGQFQRELTSFACAQGSIKDIDSRLDNNIMPIIGIDFENDLKWDGIGNMPFAEFSQLSGWVRAIHEKERKVRVYNCPNDEKIWETVLSSGVDMISTDDLARFKKFTDSRKK